jgi:hypothetical protein
MSPATRVWPTPPISVTSGRHSAHALAGARHDRIDGRKHLAVERPEVELDHDGRIRPIGAGLERPVVKEQRIVAIDAGGALRSKTANPSVFVLSVYGLSRHVNVADVVPMRRTAMNGTAGDDGYIVVGHSVLGSLVVRYLAGPRAADDPTERERDREASPRENDWRIEIPEASAIWVASARCGAAPPVNRRRGVIVAGQGCDAASTNVPHNRTVTRSRLTALPASPNLGRHRAWTCAQVHRWRRFSITILRCPSPERPSSCL